MTAKTWGPFRRNNAGVVSEAGQESPPRIRGRSRKFGVLAGFVSGAVIAGGVAYAAIPHSTTKVISACFNNSSGALRVVDTQTGATCATGETPLSWNQQGPKGLNFRSTWNSTASYAKDDVVSHLGSAYVATAPNTNVSPTVDRQTWALLAKKGDTGATGPQGPGGVRGMRMFDPASPNPYSVTWTAPAGVTAVLAEIWGGGGGGGCLAGVYSYKASSHSDPYFAGASGGGGGSGGYVRAVIPVKPGAAYTVRVGTYGRGCTQSAPSVPTAGGASSFESGSVALVRANGGGAGTNATGTCTGPSGSCSEATAGTGGAAGTVTVDPSVVGPIKLNGRAGMPGAVGSKVQPGQNLYSLLYNGLRGLPGPGFDGTLGDMFMSYANGGTGSGRGYLDSPGNHGASPGLAGAVLLNW